MVFFNRTIKQVKKYINSASSCMTNYILLITLGLQYFFNILKTTTVMSRLLSLLSISSSYNKIKIANIHVLYIPYIYIYIYIFKKIWYLT